ncbi:hypothetical protein HIM_05360 [Hirsutella minnesotensis 3608]|uniref:DUF7703 domain-containing protein n=1 Tax=Hirsutella minnesotensis 3608 TaxID=1043627 RepID=A0A0F7ZKE3_9HYPO|nr:hypothetical protein HIM_05360 [Hirsutella minnesotensis 3608]
MELSDHLTTRAAENHPLGFWIIIVVFISIALYNVVELNFLIGGTFKKFQGLYFWSLVVATWGVAFNAVGYLLRWLRVDSPGYLHSTIILVGWCTMITGQSFVMYSRLHFVLQHSIILRYVLAMIITDAILLGVPVIVLVYGTNSSHPGPFIHPYSICEKVQLTVFSLQELIISGLYIVETTKILKSQRDLAPRGARRLMMHLILINIFIVCLDVSILTLEFSGYYDIQTAWKPLVYSIKLKVEFSVLNRLVQFSQHLRTGRSLQPLASDEATDSTLRRCSITVPVTPTTPTYLLDKTKPRHDSMDKGRTLEDLRSVAVSFGMSFHASDCKSKVRWPPMPRDERANREDDDQNERLRKLTRAPALSAMDVT